MKTKTQYFILPGHVTLDSTFLIRFNGQYSYWGSRSKKWIRDPTLIKQSWIEDYCTPVSERDAKKIIREGTPPPEYHRNNPKLTIQ
jgi:penicillin-binding protein-related factor A (putative recombinase)